MTDLEKQIAAVLARCGYEHSGEIAHLLAPHVRTLIEASEEARYREGYSDGQRGNTFPEKTVAGAALSRVIEAETKVLREALEWALRQAPYGQTQEFKDSLAMARAALANSSEPKP